MKSRQVTMSAIPNIMCTIANSVRRFFHPAAIDEMLSTFVPLIDGTDLNSLLSTQYYLLTFLPQSHPQSYLPFLFRLWESVNSWAYDNRMIEFLADIAKMHVNPRLSDPATIDEIPDDARSEDEKRPNWRKDDLKFEGQWGGLYRDVGIFTTHEWDYIMCKCLATMAITLADAGSLTTGCEVDTNKISPLLEQLPEPESRLLTLARLIVYSMAQDGPHTPSSNSDTPLSMPTPPRSSTHRAHPHESPADYLYASLGKGEGLKPQAYIAGSKALNSLVKLIAPCENFFHPTNAGSWTTSLSQFIMHVVQEFQIRWHEELRPDCMTPLNRRLTGDMKRELVKSLRTVALLGIFCDEETAVGYIKECLRTMSIMEPELILHPVLERAVPSLSSLTEADRTIPITKALHAVTDSMACRKVYYPGAKHILPILELLLPGIDLNDSEKTLATTALLHNIVQRIAFGELQQCPDVLDNVGLQSTHPTRKAIPEDFGKLTEEDEDAILGNVWSEATDWVAAFVRRVILLFENLPENDPEDELVRAVCGVLQEICLHLSDPLYDMVLRMIFDYASTSTASGSLNAIARLVKSVTIGNAKKALAKFLPFCIRNIHSELKRGASSTRTTSTGSTPILSDTTLHWNLALLQGALSADGHAVGTSSSTCFRS
ncbi:hypothetical protein QCA50_004908 [Cerrena zonata]|uniref:Proteasome activator Blm10 middle HEAT repeats region domain-containing protein n=1 Tax=Cerrena zonata TaxID=2478898 RepID=A0AAW0GPK5_9APHY